MTQRFTRRTVLALAGGLFPGLDWAVKGAAGGRPFCRYSLTDGWSSEGAAEYLLRRAKANDSSGVPQIVSKISKALAVSSTFDVLILQDENNAFATVADGKRILAVDVGFLSRINRTSRTQWGAIQVIAHEIGHHIAGFGSDSHRSELNADYWSGQALRRLGSSSTAATSAILAEGTEFDTQSHPNKHRRAEVIAQGWSDASRGYVDYSFCENCH
jgi:hypothetical protein